MRIANVLSVISSSALLFLLAVMPATSFAQGLDAQEQAFIGRAMADNATQIALAKLALQKSSNPQVVALANAVLSERQSLDTRLSALIGERRTSVQPSDPALVDRLAKLDGADFDRSFAGVTVRDHNRMLSAYQCARSNTHDAGMRQLMAQAVPELQGNLMVAMTVARAAGNNPARSQQAVTAVEPRAKSIGFTGETLSSIVAVPW